MTATGPVSPSDVPRRSLGVRIRRVAGDLVIGFRDQALTLSDSAELVYRSMDGRRTVAELAALVAAEYGITESEALADISEFLDELVGTGILSW